MAGAGWNAGTSLWEQLMAGANWYYAEDGRAVGPVSFEALREMVGQGRIGVNDRVWREGEANWRGYSDVRPNYYGPSGSMGVQYYEQRPVGPSQQGMATAGLIISLVFVGLGCLWVIGVVSCLGAGMHLRP
jgi:hypothetical protein